MQTRTIVFENNFLKLVSLNYIQATQIWPTINVANDVKTVLTQLKRQDKLKFDL